MGITAGIIRHRRWKRMISRANYVAITLIMFVVLLMFQLTGISENVLMDTGENIYASEAVSEELAQNEKDRYEQQAEELYSENGTTDTVGLVGSESDECLTVGLQWCISQKKEYCYYSDLSEAAKTSPVRDS